MNPQWDESWGGALELYDENVKPVQKIWPILNRCVIFTTSDTSYHGHPEPMKLPEGMYRRSLAMYYYTGPTGRKGRSIIFPEAA